MSPNIQEHTEQRQRLQQHSDLRLESTNSSAPHLARQTVPDPGVRDSAGRAHERGNGIGGGTRSSSGPDDLPKPRRQLVALIFSVFFLLHAFLFTSSCVPSTMSFLASSVPLLTLFTSPNSIFFLLDPPKHRVFSFLIVPHFEPLFSLWHPTSATSNSCVRNVAPFPSPSFFVSWCSCLHSKILLDHSYVPPGDSHSSSHVASLPCAATCEIRDLKISPLFLHVLAPHNSMTFVPCSR